MRPRLGHEGGRQPGLGRQLLDRVLVERVPIRHLERIGVAEVYLLLAEAPFGLRELDLDADVIEVAAHGLQERLVLGRLQNVIVAAIGRGRVEALIVLVPGGLEAVLEQEKFQLGRAFDAEAERRRFLDLTLEDCARRDGDGCARVLIAQIAQHHRGLVMPGHAMEGREIGCVVAIVISGVPAGQREAGARVHVHVDDEDVERTMQALIAERRLQEGAAGDALAHQAAPDVGRRAHHGVDVAARDQRFDARSVERVHAVLSDRLEIAVELPGRHRLGEMTLPEVPLHRARQGKVLDERIAQERARQR